jgi:hypothetical protein
MGHPVGVLKRTSRDARSDFLPGDHMVIWQHSMPAGRSLTPMVTECIADSALGNSVQSARLRLISARVTILAMACKAILSKCIELSKLESIFTGGIVIPKCLAIAIMVHSDSRFCLAVWTACLRSCHFLKQAGPLLTRSLVRRSAAAAKARKRQVRDFRALVDATDQSPDEKLRILNGKFMQQVVGAKVQ